MSQFSQVRRLQKSKDHNLQRIGNTLAHLELHYNQLSTDVADATMDDIPIPAGVDQVIERFMIQLEQIRNACRASSGAEPVHVMLPPPVPS